MLTIGIVGAGFSGTALAAALHNISTCDIHLFEKKGDFGLGDAYRTPFPHHLLNVRAKDMSAFEDQPGHFVDWLKTYPATNTYLDSHQCVSEQFAPRALYGKYLQYLLQQMPSIRLAPTEVIDVIPGSDHALLVLSNQQQIKVDKVVLALGNNPAAQFPFPVAANVQTITNPWDYTAPQRIPTQDPVLIVGTGLSMIDAILTLQHQQHQGKIYAVSRHGLLPLPHTASHNILPLTLEDLPKELQALTKYVRTHSQAANTDWRGIISALRIHFPALWSASSLRDKKRFIRHLLPYWNIHRHRVHDQLANMLTELVAREQLQIFSGRVLSVTADAATIQLRGGAEVVKIEARWLINCMGPAPTMKPTQQPLVQALLERGIATLDPLRLGFATDDNGALQAANGNFLSIFYTLGSPRRAACWESSAVPEIRKQCLALAKIFA